MKKILIVMLAVITAAVLFTGCTLPQAIDTLTDGLGGLTDGGNPVSPYITDDSHMDPVEVTDVTYFSLSGGGGMEINAGYSYEAELNGDTTNLTIKVDGISYEDALQVETDASFMDSITEILKKYDVGKWNGFDKSDTGVMDGSSFYLSAAMESGDSISASGYMVYPDNYSEVAGEISALFMGIYETYRPDQGNALQRYYDEVLVPEYGEVTDTHISYPYIANTGTNFRYGEYEGQEGIIFHMITDIDDNGYEDLIAVYQTKGAIGEDACWQLSFEVYTCDDEANVTLVGGDMLDDSLFWNDDLYAEVFLHSESYSNMRYIGYCVSYGDHAATGLKQVNIKLYDMSSGEMVQLCDEWQEGPLTKEWTYEELSNFTEIAEKYGFPQSIQSWKEMPWDPVLDSGDIQGLVFYLTDTNYNSDFSATLQSTEKGKPVGDYMIEGDIHSWY